MRTPPHTIDEHVSLAEALQLMRLRRLHHLPVVRGGLVVGVLSESDLVARLHPESPRDLAGRVQDAMTIGVHVVSPDAPVHEAASLLLANDIGCLPVVEEDALVGILTARDLLRHVAHMRRAEARLRPT